MRTLLTFLILFLNIIYGFSQTISPVNPASICVGQTVSLTVDNAPSGASFQWTKDGANISGATNATYTASDAGSFNVKVNGTLTANAVSVTYTVSAPQVSNSKIEYCVNQTASALSATATTGNTLRWYTTATGGSSSATAPTPSTTTTGTTRYYVSQINSSNCESPRKEIEVVVKPRPIASFTYTPNTGCPRSKRQLQFSSTSQANNAGSLTYSWNFGDPNSGSKNTSSDPDPKHSFVGNGFNTVGDFNVSLTVTAANGCSSTVTQKITLGIFPEAILVDGQGVEKQQLTLCNNENTLTLLDASSGGINFKILWGDGSQETFSNLANGQALTHSYSIQGNLIVRYIVSSSTCSDTTDYKLYVGSNPQVPFQNPGGTTSICLPATVKIPALVSTNSIGTEYVITKNDGSAPVIMQDPPTDFIYTFTKGSCGATGGDKLNAFFIKIEAQNACGSSVSRFEPITTILKPEANFSISPSDTLCINQIFTFQNTSVAGSFPMPVIPPGGGATTYDCSNVTNVAWEIASVSGSPNSWISTGKLGKLFPLQPGDNLITASFSSPGVYSMKLAAWIKDAPQNCFRDDTVRYVCVNPIPTAAFTLSPDNGCATLQVTASGTTNTPTCGQNTFSWSVSYQPTDGCSPSNSDWAFVNGTSASSQNPQFSFVSPGIYTISLQTFAPNNRCSSTVISKTVTVRAKPNVTLSGIPATLCQNLSITPSATATCYIDASTTYAWTFTNATPSSSNQPNPGAVQFNLPGTQTVSLTVTNACGPTPAQQTLNVLPIPTVTKPSDITVCRGVSVASVVFGGSNVSGTTYSWINNNTAIGLGASGTGNLPAFIAANPTNAPITATITVTPSANNCTGTPITFTITVNPIPTVNDPVDQIICNGNNTTAVIFSGSNVTGTTYSWTNNTTSIGLAASGTGNIAAFAGTNTTNAPITATVTVTATANNCPSTPQTFTITVNPTPTVNDPADQTVCNGNPTSAINFSGNNVSGVVYNWTNNTPSIGLAGSGSGNIPSFIAVNNGASAVTATITVTPVANNCTGSSQAFTITVNPAPSVQFSIPNQNICSGASSQSVTLSSTSSNVTYSWTATQPAGITGVQTSGSNTIPVQTLTNTTNAAINVNYVATATTTGGVACPGSTFTHTITVHPVPNVGALPQTICSGTATNVVLTTTTTPSANLSYSWTVAAPTAITGATAGNGSTIAQTLSNSAITPENLTYTITPTYTIGSLVCTGPTATSVVTVNPVPVVNQPANLILCNNAASGIISFTTPVTSTTFNWAASATPVIGLPNASGVGSIPSFTAVNSTTAPISNTITVTPSFRNTSGPTCSGSPKTFTITVNPTPTVNPVSNITLCHNSASVPVNFSGTVTNTVYEWSVTGAAVGLSPTSGVGSLPTFTATNTGTTPITATVTVTPKFTNAAAATPVCTGTPITFTITVNPRPTVTPSPSAQSICSGASTNISFTSNINNGVTYAWTISNNSNINGASVGNGALIAQSLTNTSTTAQDITYTVTPSFLNNNVSCPGVPVNVVVTVNPAPSVVQPGDVTYCNNTTTAAIVFSGAVSGTNFSWTNSNTAIGLAATNGTGNISSFTATNSGTSPISSTITVTPSLASATTCSGTARTFTITVNPTPSATATPATATICSGTAPSIALTNNITGTIGSSTYTWSPSANINITGASASSGSPIAQVLTNTSLIPQSITFTITPTYTNNSVSCNGSTSTATVTVNPVPQVNQPVNLVVCNNATTGDISFSGSVTGTSYTWVNNTPTIGLAANGTGNITSFTATNSTNAPIIATITVTPRYLLSGTNFCTGPTKTFTITVNPTPTVTKPANITICNGQTSGAIVLNGTVTGTTFPWTNDQASIGLAASGTGNITAFNGINTGTAPVTATITITPTYTNAGVTCTGTNQSFTITVNPAPSVTFTPAPQTICSGQSTAEVTLGSTTSNVTYTWSSNAPSSITGATPSGSTGTIPVQTLVNNSITPQTVVYTATASTSGATACSGGSSTYNIVVNPKPVIPAQTLTICSEDVFTLTLTNNPTTTILPANTTYIWTVAANISVTGQLNQTTATSTISQSLTNLSNTQQEVVYTITPTSGAAGACPGSPFELMVKVDPKPKIPNQTATVCSGLPVMVPIPANNPSTVILPLNTTYRWTFIDNANVTGESAQATATSSITQTLINNTTQPQDVEYTVTPTTGNCQGLPFTVTITVNPAPYIPNQTAVTCSGVAFDVNPVNGVPTSATVVPAGTKYTWTVVDNPLVDGDVNQSTPQTSISQTLTNNSNTNQTVEYRVTPVSGATGLCTGPTFTVMVTLNTKPVIPAQTATICSGATFNVSPQNGVPTASTIVPSGTTYTWTVVDNADVTGESAQTTTPQTSISQQLVNRTNSVQTVVYTVTPLIGTCAGTPFTVTVTVTPAPSVQNQTATICSGETFNINLSNNPPTTILPSGTTFTWTVVDNPAVSGDENQSTAQTAISQTLTNNSNTVQTVVYTVTPRFGSCNGATFTVTVTVNPKPVIPAQTGTICSENAFTLTLTNSAPTTILPANTTYTWTVAANSNVNGQSAQSTGTSTISQTLTNLSNTQQEVVYTITPTSGAAGACPGSPFELKVKVYPKPKIPNQTATVCSGLPLTVTIPANSPPNVILPANTLYTWTFVDNTNVTGESAQATAASSITQTLTNNTTQPQDVEYTVTPITGNCQGLPFTVTITVNPAPYIPNQTAVTCSDVAFEVNPVNGVPNASTVVPAGTKYTWTVVDNPLVSGDVNESTPQTSISQTLTNISNTNQTVVYTVTPVSGAAGGCTGPTFTVTVTLNTKPVIPNQNISVCSGNAFSVPLVNNPPAVILPAGTTYTWTVVDNPDVNGESDQTTSLTSLSQTLTNTTNVPQVVIYNVTPGIGNCTGEQFTLTVTVNPAPIIPNQNTSICSGDAFTISPVNNPPSIIVPPNTTYTWTVIDNPNVTGDVSQSNAQNSISQNLTNNTNQVQTVIYTVTPLFDNCPGKSFTVNVDVNPVPRIPSETINFCSGNVFVFNPANNQPGVIVPANTTYEWTISNNPNLTGQFASTSPASGINQTLKNNSNTPQLITYTITPTSGEQGNCVGQPFTYTITVNPAPSFPTLYDTICSGSSFDSIPQNNAPDFLVPAGTTYTWSIPNMPSGLGPNVNSGTSGGVASNGPQNKIFGTLTNTAYNPLNVTYSVVPTSPNTSGAACAGAPFNYIVTVNPLPVINNNPLSQSICNSGFTAPVLLTSFTDKSTYSWRTVGTTSITGQTNNGVGDIPSMQLFNAGVKQDSVVYSVLTTANKCSGPETIYKIYINPDAKSSFTYATDFECWPFDLKTTAQITNTSPSTASDRYEWFANGQLIGTTRDFPGYTIPNPNEQVEIQLVAFSQYGCKTDTISHVFRTKKKPAASFTSSYQNPPCAPLSVNFANTSELDSDFTYKWNYGLNTLPEYLGYNNPSNPNVVYPANPNFGDTIYKVQLIVQNACYSDTARADILVSSKPKALFVPSKTTGCSPLTVDFTNVSKGVGNTYEWFIDDVLQAQTTDYPSFKYIFITGVQKVYKVKLVAKNGCGTDTVIYDLKVTPNPIKLGVFVNGTEANGCAPHTVNFVNNSTGAISFQWIFKDNDTIVTTKNTDVVPHTFKMPGTYNVEIKATSICSDTTGFVRINVYATPVAVFTTSVRSSCIGQSIQFQNNSTGNNLSYDWQFGDGKNSIAANPSHFYDLPGVYTVRLTVTSVYPDGTRCSAVTAQQITIVDELPLPVDFTLSSTLGTCLPFTIDFENQFQPYQNISWYIDGVLISSDKNKDSYTFTKTGKYKLKLVLVQAGGCKYVAEKEIEVKGVPLADFTFQPPACVGQEIEFKSSVQSEYPIASYSWKISPTGQTYSDADIKIKFLQAGVYTIEFVATTDKSCPSLPVRKTINVYSTPIVTASPDIKICQGGSVNLSASSPSDPLNYTWFPTDYLNVTTISNPVATPPDNITYTVKGTNQYGCAAYAESTIEVVKPFNMTVSEDANICIGQSIQLNASGAYAYKWSPASSLNRDDIQSPVATPTSTTTYKVVGTAELGCFPVEKEIKVGVGQYPVVTLGNDTILSTGTLFPLTSTITNGPIVKWEWLPSANLNCNTCPIPVANIKKNVTYKLIATNNFGCSGEDEINIRVFCENTQVYIPNAFTPGAGTGSKNDIFYVQGKGIMQVKSMRVYNRWGEMVFEKVNVQPNDPAFGWNGTVRNKQQGPDVFAYIVEVVCDDGTPFFYKGNVTLLK